MKIDLSGRTALITGASRGVGRACAAALAGAGARCLLLGRDVDALNTLADALEPRGVVLVADLADPAAVTAALAHCLSADIFVHCAAVEPQFQKLHAMPDTALRDTFEVDVFAATRICQAVMPEMMARGWGRVALVGSLASRVGTRGTAAYAMAKAALETLGRSLTLEYGRYGIRANTVLLGPVDGERLARRDAAAEGARKRAVLGTATRALPTPAEVADVVTFLCSEQATAIAGASVEVTGGAHLNTRW